MNARISRRRARRLILRAGNTVKVNKTDYVALVVDDPQRLPRWFAPDVDNPPLRTNVLFYFSIPSQGEQLEGELSEEDKILSDVASGNQIIYVGRRFKIQRVLPLRLQDQSIYVLAIADPS